MELLKIFNERHQFIGIKSRDEVHAKGYWHETFHCWIVLMNNSETSIYLQLRSEEKKDYPGLYDITVAGHLESDEEAQDGVREVQEELGLDIDIHSLHSLGVVRCKIHTPHIIDNEFCHQFLYIVREEPRFILQREEVVGIVKIKLVDFYEMCINENKSVLVNGFKEDIQGRGLIEQQITRANVVPHDGNYFKEIAKRLVEKCKEYAQ